MSSTVITVRCTAESVALIVQKLASLATGPIRQFKDGAKKAAIMTSTIKVLGDGLDLEQCGAAKPPPTLQT